MHALGIIAVLVLLVAIFVGGGAPARLGRVVYWGASGLAALRVLLAVFEFTSSERDGLFLGIVFGVIGFGVWRVGRAIVYVLAGR